MNQTKPNKVFHPNKLVQQHDEYLVDKSLVNRVKSAKATIKNSNTFFENRLKSRNKGRTDSGVKTADYKGEIQLETNYKPIFYGMDENLLNYINTMKNSDENTNEMNTFENKKREVKSSDIDYPATIENYKNKTAQRNKNTSRSEKNQFPTEKINKKKEVFQSDFKANLVQNTYNLGYDDFYQVEFDEKRENERYKDIEESVEIKMIENTNNINDKIVDNSHCNFDSPEIYITSKGLLRKSNYSMNKKVEKIDIEKI